MYQEIFDVGAQEFPWWFPSLGLVAIALLAGILLAHRIVVRWRSRLDWRARWARRLFQVGLAFSIVWTAWAFGSLAFAYRRAKEAHASGRDQMVEGIVGDLKHRGRGVETVLIDGHTFWLSEHDPFPGYHVTSRNGGALQPGRLVRVCYLDGMILRLEIAPGR